MFHHSYKYIYIMGHYSAFKKEENSAIYACMDEPGGHYAQWISQAEKDKYCMVSLIGGISKKKKKCNS